MDERAVDSADLRLDRRLQQGSALESDALERGAFARRVTDILRRVSPSAGLVVSVEGPWGSGKTSVLSMVQDLLKAEVASTRPVVVPFNPWRVGDRDALLRQFLSRIGSQVRLTDRAEEGRRVAKELKTYAKAFDVLKLLPGAEPWAGIVKAVVETVAQFTGAVSDHKTTDIEARKTALEAALRAFPRPIIVVIDDLDRLYPAELYEMVRIVKAVGDLPNVGYVLAWDEKYVSAALTQHGVPFAGRYLAKVVQCRLSVPPLWFSQRIALIDQCLRQLPERALDEHFPGCRWRLRSFCEKGAGELLESPRDIVRVFDMAAVIEPDLRGEVDLADLLGLVTLMVKAPAVYELLCRSPQAFVRRRRESPEADAQQLRKVVAGHAKDLRAAIERDGHSGAVQELVNWLFPLTFEGTDEESHEHALVNGRICDPGRLQLALHSSTRSNDPRLARARRYVTCPEQREEIVAGLTSLDSKDFLTQIGNVCEQIDFSQGSVHPSDLALCVARLVEARPFVQWTRDSIPGPYGPAHAAVRIIDLIASDLDFEMGDEIAERIVMDGVALSVAASMLRRSHGAESGVSEGVLRVLDDRRGPCLKVLADNIMRAARDRLLMSTASPRHLLHDLAAMSPAHCPAVFDAIAESDAELDQFAEAMLRARFAGGKGRRYSAPASSLQVFVPLEVLARHASRRLEDGSLAPRYQAAWLAVAKQKPHSVIDGTVTAE